MLNYRSRDGKTVRSFLRSICNSSIWAEEEVRREHRRLSLTLEADGWHGNVEEKMGPNWDSEVRKELG